ncbi:MAG: ABC transporter permease [Actinobacteria bacterium]|nr:permease-like cell division protein FtsX [Actinomycetota bacterium]MCB9412987.1 ABC transporter permease [Actinomycetota bacterium]
MRIRFISSEVFAGLFRNVTMTIAVILTVAVSLTLFGTGLLVRAQVNTMKDFWYDKVEVSVFLCGANSDPGICPEPITDTQRSELQAALENSSLVEQVYYESSEEAFGRFQEQFANSPILENVTAAALPESFRIKLYNPEDYPAIANALSDAAGVEVVRDQKRLLDNFFTVLNGMQALALGVSAAMLVVTVLLVANTMRVSAFSRRRETGIMKLVGASNYYIRLPFLLEAGIAAAVGGIIASGALIGLKVFLIDRVLSPTFQFTAFIGWSDIHRVLPIVLATGISLAVLAAFFAIRRYLKV